MEVTRDRLSLSADSLSTAAFLAATLIVGLLLVREVRVVPQAFSRAAVQQAAAAIVPPDAVSVPALMLTTDREVRVGDLASDAIADLQASAALITETADRGPLGARTIRLYTFGATRFLVVFEPFERGGDLRVAAIYLQ